MDFTHQKITFCNEIILQLKNKFKVKQNEKITVIQKGETQMNITKYSAQDYKGKKSLCKRISKNTTLVQLGMASLKKWQCCWEGTDVQVLIGEEKRERRVPRRASRDHVKSWRQDRVGSVVRRWRRQVRQQDGEGHVDRARKASFPHPAALCAQTCRSPSLGRTWDIRREWHHLTQFLRDHSSTLLDYELGCWDKGKETA